MTVNPPTTPNAQASELEARIRELALKYPAPDLQGWMADRIWLNEQQLKGSFDAHYGKVVAVYNKELVGVGDNYLEMMLELGPKYDVHPERIVCVYFGE